MAKTLEGVFVSAIFEKVDVFNWQDPVSGQTKPIRSLKVLLAHGDGCVTRESITLPNGVEAPRLNVGEKYALPVTVSLNKKRQTLTYTLRTDFPPMPAPAIE